MKTQQKITYLNDSILIKTYTNREFELNIGVDYIKDKNNEINLLESGIDKLEMFLQIKEDMPIINQQYINAVNFNIIVTLKIHDKDNDSEIVVVSINPSKLDEEDFPYAAEKAYLNARSSALMKYLEKRFCKDLKPADMEQAETLDTIHLEIDKEENINNNEISETTQNFQITQNTFFDNPSSSIKTPKEKMEDYSEFNFENPIITKKYLEGISLEELLATDPEYMKQLATKPNPNRNLICAFLEKNNKDISTL